MIFYEPFESHHEALLQLDSCDTKKFRVQILMPLKEISIRSNAAKIDKNQYTVDSEKRDKNEYSLYTSIVERVKIYSYILHFTNIISANIYVVLIVNSSKGHVYVGYSDPII